MVIKQWIYAALASIGLCASAFAQFADRPGGFPNVRDLEAPAAGTLSPSLPARRALLVDRIVAVVNNEVITQRDLDERVAVVTRQLQKQQNVNLPPRAVMEKQVLERMIGDRAQMQFARDSGIRIDDRAVDTAISRIAASNKLSISDFRVALERDGISYDKFRLDIREEMTLQRLKEREVDNRIQISESEIDNFLEDPNNKLNQGTVEYNFAHIMVRVPEQATPDQVTARLKRAQEAQARARNGQNFGELAISYSDAPDGLKGGDIGWRPHDRLPELFARALSTLQPGQVSDILRSPAGFHIVKLKERRGGDNAPLQSEQTHVRHILVRINELVSEAEANRKLGLLRERVLQGADFAELARLNSDDGSAGRGGDLGWVQQGDLVPEFERAMNALKPGEMSEPVKSQFGLHLIQVLERRLADVTGDRKRMEARKILRERRIDETYQEWARSIRDRAFVEYRLEER
ncbi:MAG TPA: peptidylprolyl isomerase [Burkholderiales bacterium]|nr:peptidylprolyl isomerase [Burkholderiales bacterium]